MSFVNTAAYLSVLATIHDICILRAAGINCNIYLHAVIKVSYYTWNCSMETVEKNPYGITVATQEQK